MATKEFRSSVVIAKLLDSEGFTARVANGVRKYNKQYLKSAGQKLIRYEKSKQAFSQLLKDKSFTDGDKAILGRFMATFAAYNFNTGLTIGLATNLFKE